MSWIAALVGRLLLALLFIISGLQKVLDPGPTAAMLEATPSARLAGHAADAESAIRDILAGSPDVVLLDISLADGSGFDVLRAVRPQAPQIDFYVLSNVSSYPYRQLAGTLGARGFFDKSTEFERVRDSVPSLQDWEVPARPRPSRLDRLTAILAALETDLMFA